MRNLKKATAVRDATRYFTREGPIVDLLWLRANTHDPESHTPDFIVSIDSQIVVVIEAKNWGQPPNTTRTKLYILTRYESYQTAPCKLLLITAPIPTHVQPLLIQEHINSGYDSTAGTDKRQRFRTQSTAGLVGGASLIQ